MSSLDLSVQLVVSVQIAVQFAHTPPVVGLSPDQVTTAQRTFLCNSWCFCATLGVSVQLLAFLCKCCAKQTGQPWTALLARVSQFHWPTMRSPRKHLSGADHSGERLGWRTRKCKTGVTRQWRLATHLGEAQRHCLSLTAFWCAGRCDVDGNRSAPSGEQVWRS